MAQQFNQFDPRQRFNWGFHDGVQAEQAGRILPFETVAGIRKHDDDYQIGVYYGRDSVKENAVIDNSDHAWAYWQHVQNEMDR